MTTKVLDYFSALAADDDSIPLTEIALSIAQDAYPDLDLQVELVAIDVLVTRVKNYTAENTPAIQRLCLLNQFFHQGLGFGPNADDYCDPENSYLNAVLQSRRSIPIPLAMLLMEIDQQISLPLRSVSFPNHFLVRMSIPADEVVLDPLTGQTLSKEELQDMLDPYLEKEGIEDPNSMPLRVSLQVATHHEIIACILRSLKTIYLQRSHWQRLLVVQQRLVILLPDPVEEVRGWGLAYTNLGCFRLALEDLEMYVSTRPDAADIAKLKKRMPTLRVMSKSLN